MITYIAFEGINGAGKSTQIGLFSNWLSRRYYTSIAIFEPTYGRFGTKIRTALEHRKSISLEEQIRLFTMDRREHVERKIRPLLQFVQTNPSFVILQDRCYLSAPAYQAHGRSAMLSILKEQRSISPAPDIIFLLDAPVKQALERKACMGRRRSQFEEYTVLNQIRENYLFLARESTERVTVIDAAKNTEDVHRAIINSIAHELKPIEYHGES